MSADIPLSMRIAYWLVGREDAYSTREIAICFGANNTTIANALSELAKRGDVELQKRKGVSFWRIAHGVTTKSLKQDFAERQKISYLKKKASNSKYKSRQKTSLPDPHQPCVHQAGAYHPFAYYQLPRYERRLREGRPTCPHI